MDKYKSFVLALLGALGYAGTVVGTPAIAEEDRVWQLEMVFHPSAQQLAIERKGRVMIYSGLRDTDVERAMDEQWDRVNSMMFIKTIVTDPEGKAERDPGTGSLVFGDDDC
ncbi:MAG: hypothetical protein PVG98_01940 [Chromatiales bacterium]